MRDNDEVNCYACDSSKAMWKVGEDPWIIHARNKDCPFIGANDSIVQHHINEAKRIAKVKQRIEAKAKKAEELEAKKKEMVMEMPTTSKATAAKDAAAKVAKRKKMTLKEELEIAPYTSRAEWSLIDPKDKCGLLCDHPANVILDC